MFVPLGQLGACRRIGKLVAALEGKSAIRQSAPAECTLSRQSDIGSELKTSCVFRVLRPIYKKVTRKELRGLIYVGGK